MAQESGFCSHCKRNDIPVANLDIHIVHCKRNAVSCPICHVTMPRALLEEHHETTHAERRCPQCEATMEIAVFDSHLADSCPMRQLECCYCQLHFAHRSLAEHLSYCGSRTERCELCSRFVMLKDRLRHDETACGFPPAAIGGGTASGGGALQAEAEDDIMGTDCIPCEFCKRKFHVQEIMHHQSSCVQSPLVSPAIFGMPEHTYSSNHGDNILSSLLDDLRLSATGMEAGAGVSPLASPLFVDGLAADMVPCEFCSACLPMDLLPHHQDVCARLSSSLGGTSGRKIRGRIGTRALPFRGEASAARHRSPEQEIALRMLRSRAAHLSDADQSHGGSGEPTANIAYRAKVRTSKADAHRTVEPRIKRPEASAASGTALLHPKAPSLPVAEVTGIADSKRPSPASISLAGTQAGKPEVRQGQAFRVRNSASTATDETASVSHPFAMRAVAEHSLPISRRTHGGVPMLTAKQPARGDPGVTSTPVRQLQPTAAAVTARHVPTARAAAPRPPSTRNTSGAGGSDGTRNSQFLVSGVRPTAREGQADASSTHIHASAARAPARGNATAFDRVGAAPRNAARPS